MNRLAPVLFTLAALLVVTGCQHTAPPAILSPPQQAANANAAFLNQETYDPWLLSTTDPKRAVNVYMVVGSTGTLSDAKGQQVTSFEPGHYKNGALVDVNGALVAEREHIKYRHETITSNCIYRQTLDMRTNALTSDMTSPIGSANACGNGPFSIRVTFKENSFRNWPALWQKSDIIINGDAQAQQVTHANLFYLLSSTYPGSTHSIPPMGLSSNAYGGHIFWDADVWMLPALIVQHPEYAKPIVDYRFARLAQAKANAKSHHFPGAEYPWESADTGKEVAPPEFAQERHITADVAFAAWQYYLWTGDQNYLKSEGFPLLSATADYWMGRVTKQNGQYHILHVLSPDETAGVVNDDAYTNAVVRYNCLAATRAAQILGQRPNPRWADIAKHMAINIDPQRNIPQENSAPLTDRLRAKQADTLLLIHPLGDAFGDPYSKQQQAAMLDFYAAHTIPTGPAMTASIQAIVAARLGQAQPSLDEFYASYRPFMRAPWDAFSEKRTTNNVYFLTGMAGCVQSVLYGFAGLQAVVNSDGSHTVRPVGTKIAGDAIASLYADPHLPPGWGGLIIKGIRFRGKTFTLTIGPGNTVRVT